MCLRQKETRFTYNNNNNNNTNNNNNNTCLEQIYDNARKKRNHCLYYRVIVCNEQISLHPICLCFQPLQGCCVFYRLLHVDLMGHYANVNNKCQYAVICNKTLQVNLYKDTDTEVKQNCVKN